MERFSLRRFLLLLLILGIGVGIGAGLERHFHPPGTRASPVPPPPAPAPPSARVSPSPSGLACSGAASFQDNLYPSLMLSFGGMAPEFTRCLAVEVRNAPVGGTCQIRMDSSLLQEPFLATVPVASARFTVSPDIPWNYDALRRVTQLRPETFVIAVTVDEKTTVQSSFMCMVHPVNEVVSRVLDAETGEWQDTSICYAAFVNEDHPWIGALLQEAASRGGLARFTGYELGPHSVAEQVRAIWEALAARGLTYVDLATTSGGVPGVASQYVRFLDQSVKDRGANCVDASVLLASIFRRIGLRPVLIFVPGHCLVAVYDSPQGGQMMPVETTMLGVAPFSAALGYAGKEMAAALPNMNSPGYSSVDIALARQAGVRPIEYAGPQ